MTNPYLSPEWQDHKRLQKTCPHAEEKEFLVEGWPDVGWFCNATSDPRKRCWPSECPRRQPGQMLLPLEFEEG